MLGAHAAAGWLLVAASFALIGFYLPPSIHEIGESYLIFFVHFPSAVTSLLFFLVAGALSVAYLVKGRERLDLAASGAVDVGLLGCTITLVTGSIWAKAAWGIWWDSADPRLLTVAIMWLTYLGYFVLRTTLDEPVRRARFSAVFGILAALNIPLVFFAVRIFRPVHHPVQVTMAEREMVITRWFGVLAFLCLYSAFWRLRYRASVHRASCLRMEQEMSRSGL